MTHITKRLTLLSVDGHISEFDIVVEDILEKNGALTEEFKNRTRIPINIAMWGDREEEESWRRQSHGWRWQKDTNKKTRRKDIRGE